MQSEDRTIYLDLLRRLRGMTSAANSGILRAPSKNEQAEQPRAAGYYSFFCIHNRHKWNTCGSCKRSKREADALREAYIAKLSQLVP